MRRAGATVLALAAGTLAAAAGPLAAQPADRSWHLASFDARVRVGADGGVSVRERIDVSFRGSYRGIYRDIPVEYETPAGLGYDVDVEELSVRGEDGRSLRFETSREGRYLRVRIWVPGAEDATRTVQLGYRVDHVLRFDDRHDELYWNVTGTGWPVPIDRARVRLELPDGVTGVRTVAYRGPYGSSREVPTARPDRTVVTAATRDLSIREGLTVSALWERGVVSRPTLLDRAAHFLGSNWPIGAGLLAAVGMGVLWWRRGRDPEVETIPVRYEPPDGLRPAAAGILLDHRLDGRDLTATVVDLAVRGYVEIAEEEDEDAYSFRLLVPEEEWGDDLAPHEIEVLEGLFPGGEEGASTDTEALENSFYRSVEGIRDALYEGPLAKLVRSRSDRVRGMWLTAGLGTAFFLGFLPLAMEIRFAGATPLSLTLGLAVAGAAMAGFGYFMPVRTAVGTRRLAEVLGFEEFLTRVEEDRFREMIRGPEDFERYLPYAMAFGVAKTWARAFEDILTEPPEWYAGRGGGRFAPVHFARSMEGFSETAGNSMTSRPRGQGTSGGSAFSGGGGFSGGGMGGGGGGAF